MKKLPETVWRKLGQYAKHRILAKYDPSVLVPPIDPDLPDLRTNHKGFYVGINDSSNAKVVRVGFLEEDNLNVLNSLDRVLEAVYAELSAKGVSSKVIQTSAFYLTLVLDVIFTNNGLGWDENEDGIYLSWGDRYKGLYLPYEVKQMSVKKTEIMNRLCSWETKIMSNAWRYPECMCSRLVADSFFWN